MKGKSQDPDLQMSEVKTQIAISQHLPSRETALAEQLAACGALSVIS